jgi:hypothetical protein
VRGGQVLKRSDDLHITAETTEDEVLKIFAMLFTLPFFASLPIPPLSGLHCVLPLFYFNHSLPLACLHDVVPSVPKPSIIPYHNSPKRELPSYYIDNFLKPPDCPSMNRASSTCFLFTTVHMLRKQRQVRLPKLVQDCAHPQLKSCISVRALFS